MQPRDNDPLAEFVERQYQRLNLWAQNLITQRKKLFSSNPDASYLRSVRNILERFSTELDRLRDQYQQEHSQLLVENLNPLDAKQALLGLLNGTAASSQPKPKQQDISMLGKRVPAPINSSSHHELEQGTATGLKRSALNKNTTTLGNQRDAVSESPHTSMAQGPKHSFDVQSILFPREGIKPEETENQRVVANNNSSSKSPNSNSKPPIPKKGIHPSVKTVSNSEGRHRDVQAEVEIPIKLQGAKNFVQQCSKSLKRYFLKDKVNQDLIDKVLVAIPYPPLYSRLIVDSNTYFQYSFQDKKLILYRRDDKSLIPNDTLRHPPPDLNQLFFKFVDWYCEYFTGDDGNSSQQPIVKARGNDIYIYSGKVIFHTSSANDYITENVIETKSENVIDYDVMKTGTEGLTLVTLNAVSLRISVELKPKSPIFSKEILDNYTLEERKEFEICVWRILAMSDRVVYVLATRASKMNKKDQVREEHFIDVHIYQVEKLNLTFKERVSSSSISDIKMMDIKFFERFGPAPSKKNLLCCFDLSNNLLAYFESDQQPTTVRALDVADSKVFKTSIDVWSVSEDGNLCGIKKGEFLFDISS